MASAFRRPGNKFFARIKLGAKFIDGKWQGGDWVARVTSATTMTAARAVARAMQAQVDRVALGIEAPAAAGELCGPSLKRWAASLDNRARDIDRGRIAKHLVPRWRNVRVADIDLPRIMAWLDDLADGPLSPGSQRHMLGLLSRFLSWAVARGHAPRNACKDIPPGKRPRAIPPRPETVPVLRDDDQVVAIMRSLPAPFDAIFYLGNRCGLRVGELLGLRIGDLDQIGDGVIRVSHSYGGFLKEDRGGVGKVKLVPAPNDASAVLAPILAQRHAAGAGDDALLFVDQDGDAIDRHQLAHRWRVVRRAFNLPDGLSFYKASRHSFATRALAAGAGVDEIAAALGHSSPTITARHYLHHVRRHFSPILTAGLGLDGAPGGKVIQMHSPATAEPQTTATEEGSHAA